MNLLLTGASGFLGRNIILHSPPGWRILAVYNRDAGFPAFASPHPNVTPAAADLANPDAAAALFERYGRDWDCCLHLAAKVDIPWSVREPRADLEANTAPLLNVLERIRAGKVVFFSSGAVYDGLEGEARPDARVAPSLPYAISKLTCERYVEFYRERRRAIDRHLNVRFFGAYGPYEAGHKIYTRLVRAFALEGRDEYTIFGDGQNLIDAMYVEDAVEAVVRMVNGSHWNGTLNLAGGHPVTIEALVRQASEALGVPSVRIRKDGVAHESNRFWGSTDEMMRWYGFEPRVPLADGILRLRDFLAAGQAAAGGAH
jgi:nucleoside-diphosphate-sugar epimerase